MSGEFTISLSRDEFVSAYWCYTRWMWLWRRLAVATTVLGVIFTLVFAGADALDGTLVPANALVYLEYGMIYAVIGAIVLIATTCVTFPRRLKRLYNDLRVEGRETRFEFDSTGLRSSNRDGTGNFEWNRFKHWIENERFLIFVLSRWSFVIVPKAQVTEEVLTAVRAAASVGGVIPR